MACSATLRVPVEVVEHKRPGQESLWTTSYERIVCGVAGDHTQHAGRSSDGVTRHWLGPVTAPPGENVTA